MADLPRERYRVALALNQAGRLARALGDLDDFGCSAQVLTQVQLAKALSSEDPVAAATPVSPYLQNLDMRPHPWANRGLR
jgi:hypothetical protein